MESIVNMFFSENIFKANQTANIETKKKSQAFVDTMQGHQAWG